MYTIYLETGEVVRNADNKTVAPCQSTTDPDYVQYVEWVAAGNEPSVGDVAQGSSIKSVTPRQIRLALNAMQLRDAIEAAVAASSQDVKDSWEFSTEFERSNPLIDQMAGTLNIAPASVDALFALAATY